MFTGRSISRREKEPWCLSTGNLWFGGARAIKLGVHPIKISGAGVWREEPTDGRTPCCQQFHFQRSRVARFARHYSGLIPCVQSDGHVGQASCYSLIHPRASVPGQKHARPRARRFPRRLNRDRRRIFIQFCFRIERIDRLRYRTKGSDSYTWGNNFMEHCSILV